MRCAWNELMALVPLQLRKEVDKYAGSLQELRLRAGLAPEIIAAGESRFLEEIVLESDIRFVVNGASRYSPWAADTAAQGYLTAPGGHRVGLCGSHAPTGLRDIQSVNIRVARDFPGIADKLCAAGNILILGPPGSGKTTLLRDLIRRLSREETVSVVDQRGEIFPRGFDRGLRTDVLTGCKKAEGIEMLLRAMGPQTIALDEITAAEDCDALRSALWCGVRLVATAHASHGEDLKRRPLYRPLAESGCFDTLVVLHRDKSWHTERLTIKSQDPK